MKSLSPCRLLPGALLLLSVTLAPIASGTEDAPPWLREVPSPGATTTRQATTQPSSELPSVEATIIKPFRSADVGPEVEGVIKVFHFEEGDKIQEGQPVFEICADRYRMNLRQTEEKVEGVEEELRFFTQEMQVMAKLSKTSAASEREYLRGQASEGGRSPARASESRVGPS